MKTNEIIIKATAIRDCLKFCMDYQENPIDDSLLPIPPFKISDQIKLIIVGQDPTIRNKTKRKNVETTLNLDKQGPLRKYILDICFKLEIDFHNIYATNVFKYFYLNPPSETFYILQNHLCPNLKLLKEELSNFPNLPVITLGDPVLKLLTKDQNNSEIKYFWDYNPNTKSSNMNFKYCQDKDNQLDRKIFPMPHQPSISKGFYSKFFKDYIDLLRKEFKN